MPNPKASSLVCTFDGGGLPSGMAATLSPTTTLTVAGGQAVLATTDGSRGDSAIYPAAGSYDLADDAISLVIGSTWTTGMWLRFAAASNVGAGNTRLSMIAAGPAAGALVLFAADEDDTAYVDHVSIPLDLSVYRAWKMGVLANGDVRFWASPDGGYAWTVLHTATPPGATDYSDMATTALSLMATSSTAPSGSVSIAAYNARLGDSVTSLLQLKSDFFRHQNLQWSGTATGGGTTKLTDSTLKVLPTDSFPVPVKGRQIRVTSGSASGDLRLVADVDRTEGDLFPNRDFSAAVAAADTYELWGTVIYGGQPLTDLFNDVLRRLRPRTRTAVTIVTNQSVYDVSTLVGTRQDILGVWRYDLDPANLRPYTPVPLRFEAWDTGGGATPTVTIDIGASITRNDSTVALYVEHYTSFTPFTSDTSTVDSNYRDLLAWEAILALAERKLEEPTQDRGYWTERYKRARRELSTLRERWVEPREPVRIQAV